MYIYLWGCMQTSVTLCMSLYCNSWFDDVPTAPGPLGFLLTLLSATVNKTIESGRGTERSESRGSTRQISVTTAEGESTRGDTCEGRKGPHTRIQGTPTLYRAESAMCTNDNEVRSPLTNLRPTRSIREQYIEPTFNVHWGPIF